MHIQYYLADGQEISYQTALDMPTVQDVDAVALQYAQKRHTVLPEFIFVSVRIYAHFITSMGVITGFYTSFPGPQIMSIHTSVGPLQIRIMPWASDAKLFLIGKMDDFERYDIDKIFEDVVLAGCERE